MRSLDGPFIKSLPSRFFPLVIGAESALIISSFSGPNRPRPSPFWFTTMENFLYSNFPFSYSLWPSLPVGQAPCEFPRANPAPQVYASECFIFFQSSRGFPQSSCSWAGGPLPFLPFILAFLPSPLSPFGDQSPDLAALQVPMEIPNDALLLDSNVCSAPFLALVNFFRVLPLPC